MRWTRYFLLLGLCAAQRLQCNAPLRLGSDLHATYTASECPCQLILAEYVVCSVSVSRGTVQGLNVQFVMRCDSYFIPKPHKTSLLDDSSRTYGLGNIDTLKTYILALGKEAPAFYDPWVHDVGS